MINDLIEVQYGEGYSVSLLLTKDSVALALHEAYYQGKLRQVQETMKLFGMTSTAVKEKKHG